MKFFTIALFLLTIVLAGCIPSPASIPPTVTNLPPQVTSNSPTADVFPTNAPAPIQNTVEADNNSPRQMTIGMSFNRLGPPLFNAWQKYMILYANEIRAKGEIDIQWVFLNADGNSGQQSTDILNLIDQKVDLIAIRPEDPAVLTAAVQAGQQAGIPFLAFDRPMDELNLVPYVGVDNYTMARNAAKNFSEILHENNINRLKCIEVLGDPLDITAVERSVGWQNVEVETAAWRTVIQARTDWEPDRFYTSIRDAQYWYPDVNCMFLVSDQNFAQVEKALQEYDNLAPPGDSRHIWIVSLDLSPGGMLAMQNGYIDVSGVYDAYVEVTTFVDLAIKFVMDGELDKSEYLVSGRIVTPETLENTPHLWARKEPE